MISLRNVLLERARAVNPWHLAGGSYKTWTGLWTGFWTGLWNACELSFKLVEMQVEMLKTAVV